MSKIKGFKTTLQHLEFTSIKEADYADKDKSLGLYEINLIPEKSYQDIIGFRGAFNEVGAEALNTLPEDKKKEVFRELFLMEALCVL